MTKQVWWVWAALAGLLATGCEVAPWVDREAAAFPPVPPDFSLVFTVQTTDEVKNMTPALAQPLYRPAQHVLTPERVLRVAYGPGVTRQLFPEPTATLTPAQVEDLWRIIVINDLLHHTGDARSEAPVTYYISITAGDERYRYATTPNASTGAVDLLRALVALRGEKPAADSEPTR